MRAFGITPKAPVGSLLKGSTKPAKGKRQGARQHDDAHLKFIRLLPSLVPGQGPVEAAHLRYADRLHGKPLTGIGVKPDDRYVLPLAHGAHMDQHAHPEGERAWWASWGLDDPIVVSTRLWLVTGDFDAGVQIIRETIEFMSATLKSREAK